MVWVTSTNGDFSVASVWEEARQKQNASLIDRYVWGVDSAPTSFLFCMAPPAPLAPPR